MYQLCFANLCRRHPTMLSVIMVHNITSFLQSLTYSNIKNFISRDYFRNLLIITICYLRNFLTHKSLICRTAMITKLAIVIKYYLCFLHWFSPQRYTQHDVSQVFPTYPTFFCYS